MSDSGATFMDRLRAGLGRSRSGLVDGVRRLFGRGVDADTLEELEGLLIQADLGVETAMGLVADLRERARREGLRESDALMDALQDEIRKRLAPGDHHMTWDAPDGPPHVTLVVGVNGTGKTTTIGKLAAHLARDGRRVLLGASDTFRAAAIDQLAAWADRANVEIVRHAEGADPGAVAYDTIAAAESRRVDNVLIDTAGRLHTKVNLMNELQKVRRVVNKRLPDAPHEVLLVLDATTGQNGLQQARLFTEATGVTGAVLTKLDGTAKGGMVVAIQKELGLPIKFVGVGEGIDDLQPFDAEAFTTALFN